MPKPANPLLSISKKIEALKSKSERLAQEIGDLSALVAAEAIKAQSTTPAPAPAAKKPVAKKATVSGEPKKRGRPAKAKVEAKPSSLSMLNAEPTFEPPTKKRGKK